MLMPVALIAVISLDRLHQAQRDQHRQQNAQVQNVVEKKGRDVEQVLAYDQRRNPVAQDVSQQLKESEHLQQHEERRQDHGQIDHKIPQTHSRPGSWGSWR